MDTNQDPRVAAARAALANVTCSDAGCAVCSECEEKRVAAMLAVFAADAVGEPSEDVIEAATTAAVNALLQDDMAKTFRLSLRERVQVALHAAAPVLRAAQAQEVERLRFTIAQLKIGVELLNQQLAEAREATHDAIQAKALLVRLVDDRTCVYGEGNQDGEVICRVHDSMAPCAMDVTRDFLDRRLSSPALRALGGPQP